MNSCPSSLIGILGAVKVPSPLLFIVINSRSSVCIVNVAPNSKFPFSSTFSITTLKSPSIISSLSTFTTG